MNNQEVEEGADLLTPVKEEGVEHPREQVAVESLLEIGGEDQVELVNERQHLNRLMITFWRR